MLLPALVLELGAIEYDYSAITDVDLQDLVRLRLPRRLLLLLFVRRQHLGNDEPAPALEEHVLARVHGLREVADYLCVHLADLEVSVAEPGHDAVAEEALDGVLVAAAEVALQVRLLEPVRVFRPGPCRRGSNL